MSVPIVFSSSPARWPCHPIVIASPDSVRRAAADVPQSVIHAPCPINQTRPVADHPLQPTDGQTDRRTDRRADRRTDRQTGGQTNKRRDGQTDGRTDRQTGGRTDRRADRRAGKRTDKRADRSGETVADRL